MEYLDRPFEVSTGSGRRPTPITYEHLRDYPALVKQYLRLSSQTDIVNVNDILNLTGNLYVSNEISRVIAQLIGQLDPGFVTIKGTEDGALHVYPAEGSEEGKIDVKVADGDNETLGEIADAMVAAGAVGTLSAKLRRVTQGLEDLKSLVVLAAGSHMIGKVQIERSSHTIITRKIDVSGTGAQDVILTGATGSYHICSIAFTVDSETTIALESEGTVHSGPMFFGGTGQPWGMTHNFGLAPLICAATKKFQLNLTISVNVHGIITYYDA